MNRTVNSSEKILQIIPVSSPVFAKYKEDKDNSFFFSRIHCFALTEEANGDRFVRAMDLDKENGFLCFVDECSNFIGLTEDSESIAKDQLF